MKEYLMEVVRSEACAKGIHRLEFACTAELASAVKPGQFAHYAVPDRPDLLLRRPFDIYDVDVEKKTITSIFIVKGKGTTALSKLHRGAQVSALAPLGNGFPDVRGKKVFLLGGGVGVTPLYAVAKQAASSVAFFGWRSKDYVFALDELLGACSELNVYTDDGSMGQKGYAIEGLAARLRLEKPDMLLACGPEPMFKALQDANFADVPTYISLEQRMGCGVGVCLVCTCKVKKPGGETDNLRICMDGPVFKLEEVVLDA